MMYESKKNNNEELLNVAYYYFSQENNVKQLHAALPDYYVQPPAICMCTSQ